jgi:hypothetical protein
MPGMQGRPQAPICATRATNGPTFKCTRTSHDPLTPQLKRIDHANQHQMPHRQATPAERRVSLYPLEARLSTHFAAARSRRRRKPRKPPASRLYGGGPDGGGVHRRRRVRKSSCTGSERNGRVRQIDRENGELENPGGKSRDIDGSPRQRFEPLRNRESVHTITVANLCHDAHKGTRQPGPPGPASTTLATQFRGFE